MTGLELLEGLSFVDERFIAEADRVSIARKTPWMKVLSVAACLCILIMGALALENMGAKEEAAAPAAVAPDAVTESAMEEAAPREESTTEEATEAAAAVADGELEHIPYAVVRIVRSMDDGSFGVVVEELTQDPTALAVGMELTLVIDPDMVPDREPAEEAFVETISEDMTVQIQNGAYDAGSNTLYAAGVSLPEE